LDLIGIPFSLASGTSFVLGIRAIVIPCRLLDRLKPLSFFFPLVRGKGLLPSSSSPSMNSTSAVRLLGLAAYLFYFFFVFCPPCSHLFFRPHFTYLRFFPWLFLPEPPRACPPLAEPLLPTCPRPVVSFLSCWIWAAFFGGRPPAGQLFPP